MNRLMSVLLVLLVAALFAASCADADTSSSFALDSTPTAAPADSAPAESAALGLDPGDYTFELVHDGRTRSYIVHVPTTTLPLAPIVVALHGGGGTGRAFQEQNGLDAVADREGFVAVYPEGTGILPNRLHTWNSGKSCCGFALDRDIDDVGFLRAVIADLTTQIEVDPGRVYMTGHSNGAMMAYRFANEAPEMVTAIVPVGGAPDLDLVAPTHPVAVLHIHSRDDPRALYEGGEGPPFPGTDRTVPHEPVRDGIDAWAAMAGCETTPTTGPQIAGTPPNDDQTTQLIVWSNCAEGTRVEHLLLTGTGHGWPGVEVPRAVQRILGPPTTIIDASEEVWAFVSQFER